MRISISPSVGYFSFGFVPTGSLRADLRGRLFGAPILLKRLQARDIMAALEIRPEDAVLDFGCGGGYITVEMAKLARNACGVDVNPYIESIRIPPQLQGRLEYRVVEGRGLPFPDGCFDRVLASEVLPMAADPVDFLNEIRRVLKPRGRLVVVNGAGHPAIKQAYGSSSWILRILKRWYPDRMPSSYEEYCAILQPSFSTAQRRFFEKDDISGLLSQCGFKLIRFDCSPGFVSGAYLSWSQFLRYLRTGRTLTQKNFEVNFLVLSLIRLFESRKYEGGLLCVAER